LGDGKRNQERRQDLTAFAGIDAGEVLRQGMKVCELNHRILANNIANAETPGYRGLQLDFQTTLRNAINADRRASLRSAQAGRVSRALERPEFKDLASLSKNDYNTVDIDNEMVRLSENTGNYTVFSTILAKRFGTMKNMLNMLR
jgi:flagellar basal-body rod protein FlgB